MPALRPTIRLVCQVARVVAQGSALYLDIDDLTQGRMGNSIISAFRRKKKRSPLNNQERYAARARSTSYKEVQFNRPHKPMKRR